jgi:hypothetical protein
VFSSSFQCGFGLPACDFLHGLLDYYQIELVHLNPNSTLQIVVFLHLCKAFLGIPPNFPLLKNYFFLKYQPSASNRKVIGGVGLQTLPRAGFLYLPLKSSLRGWHGTWLYCENHEPCLPSFVERLPEFQGTSWSEESTPLETPQVVAQIDKVNLLKDKCLTKCVRVCPLVDPSTLAAKETSSPGLGILRILRPDSGNSRKNNPRASDKAPGGNVLRYF